MFAEIAKSSVKTPPSVFTTKAPRIVCPTFRNFEMQCATTFRLRVDVGVRLCLCSAVVPVCAVLASRSAQVNAALHVYWPNTSFEKPLREYDEVVGQIENYATALSGRQPWP